MIRTFQPGDIMLLQRLQRQSTKLNAVNALLTPRPALWTAVASSFMPMLHRGAAVTYVLRQEGNGVDRAGFLQAQRRPGRPEDDLLLLAPALETRSGHPAIWLKLLSHYINETIAMNAASQAVGIQRIYADVPDQPLLVQTFAQVGFAVYARQTIWRLTDWEQFGTDQSERHRLGSERARETQRRLRGFPDAGQHDASQHETGWHPGGRNLQVRPATRQDDWALLRLYALATPRKVQIAEGAGSMPGSGWESPGGSAPGDGLSQSGRSSEGPLDDASPRPPILEWWQGGEVTTLVLEENGELRASLRVVVAHDGIWLQFWADTLHMESTLSAELIGQGLRLVQHRVAQQARRLPVYTAVRDYQGGLGPVLANYGFAPVMDHAKMVKQMVQRAIETETVRSHSVEAMPEAVVTMRHPSAYPVSGVPAVRQHRIALPSVVDSTGQQQG